MSTNTPVDKYVGQRIRSQRLVRGISQTSLGDAIGVTFQQIQKYEKGTNRCAGENLVSIANNLGVTPGWFFEGAPGLSQAHDNSEAQEITAFMATADGIEIARAVSRIGPHHRRAIARFVTEMASPHLQAAE